jgi:hypothetical protein
VIEYFTQVAEAIGVPLMVQDAPSSPAPLPVRLLIDLSPSGALGAVRHRSRCGRPQASCTHWSAPSATGCHQTSAHRAGQAALGNLSLEENS